MPSNDTPKAKAQAVILSPPGNPAAFSEIQEFLHNVEVHDWRFNESDLTNVHDIVEGYRDEIPDKVLDDLDAEKFSAMFIACTGMSYGHTPQEDHSYWNELQDSTGLHIATATRAVEELWRQQEYDAMILVSPYDDRATSEAEKYWSRLGFQVKQIIRVQGGHPYKVTTKDLEHALHQTRLEPGVPLLLSGTGMQTKNSLAWIESLHDAPVWSVNLAGAQWLQKVTR